MRTVHIAAETPYDVVIGRDLRPRLREACADAGHILVVTDDIVERLHGDYIKTALTGLPYELIRLPHGEENKNLSTLGIVLERAAQAGLGRKDVFVAFGGGVIGDLTGFAAAVYMRGIRFIQLPTTLLSAVDASVGGKTAVDLPQGKNLAGAFHTPACVLCDTALLETLPPRQFSNGMAEVIKHGVLGDAALLDMAAGEIGDIEALIERNVRVKAAVVEADEREAGLRKILNFGHTAGHALERLSDYSLLHGEAVAAGMMFELRLGTRLGVTDPALPERVETLLKRHNLPVQTGFSMPELIEAMRLDKKNEGGYIVFELPVGGGQMHEIRLTAAELAGLNLL